MLMRYLQLSKRKPIRLMIAVSMQEGKGDDREEGLQRRKNREGTRMNGSQTANFAEETTRNQKKNV